VPRYASSAASAGLGLALAGVAFGAKGGSELSRTTTVEMLLILAGGLLVAFSIAYGPRERLYGGATLAFFAAYAALTALSVLWSVSPDLSWIEANRTLSYLVVFAAALATARLAPAASPALLRGLLVAAAIVIGYALASRVWPGTLAENEIYARVGQPYGYWNAVGATAALAMPPALWLGARRSGHAPANALAYPLMGLLIVALFLSYSRGSLGAAAIALLAWFAFVPLRLRSLVVLLVPAALAAPVIAWALSRDAFTKDLVPLAVRESVADEFGLLLLVMTLALLAAGLAVGFRLGLRAPRIALRRRVGVAAVAVVCALPFVAFSSVALSERGLGGTISDRYKELTSESAKTPGGPDRLTKASSSRGRYWRQAGRIFEDRPELGTGAGTFGVARLRYRRDELVARHAHGFVAQTMADLGIAGLLAALALAGAWLATAARNVGAWPRRPPIPWDAERIAVMAIALAALVFGLHSAIDWTWFVPGPAVIALVAAGFVAGRGPVPVLGLGGLAPAGAPTALEAAGLRERARTLLSSRPPRGRLALGVALLLTTLVCVWTVWQPERADDEAGHAIRFVEQGELEEAQSAAESASDINPLSPRPLWVEALVQDTAGRPKQALATLEDAVIRFPGNPRTWERLAEFQLQRLGRPRDALRTLDGLLYLDPRSRSAQLLFVNARSRIRGEAQPPAGAAPQPAPAVPPAGSEPQP
jgi:tetratricopeptide (TPR) repeat protein